MKYINKETGLELEAVRYRMGNNLEHGFKKDNNGNNRPYIRAATANGFWKDTFLNEKMFIVKYGKYTFVYEEDVFLKLYKRG